MKDQKFYWCLILLLFVILIRCSSKPDLTQIDQLIAEGKYHKAQQLILKELKKEWSDTLQLKRLQYRLIKIEKGLIFKKMDSLMTSRPEAALIELKTMEDSLLKLDKEKSKYFFFDLHYRRAQIFKQQGKDSLWFKETLKALNSFTDNYQLKRTLYEQSAFFLAKHGKYAQGLKMLDASLREVRLSQLSEELKNVYYAYLNGNFKKALSLLQTIPETQKDEHWRNLEKFLNHFATKISPDERFKLW